MSVGKAFGIVGLVCSVLVGISIFRALLLHEPPIVGYCSPDEEHFVSDTKNILKRFSEAIRFQTVSYNHHTYEKEALSNFVNYILKSK